MNAVPGFAHLLNCILDISECDRLICFENLVCRGLWILILCFEWGQIYLSIYFGTYIYEFAMRNKQPFHCRSLIFATSFMKSVAFV